MFMGGPHPMRECHGQREGIFGSGKDGRKRTAEHGVPHQFPRGEVRRRKQTTDRHARALRSESGEKGMKEISVALVEDKRETREYLREFIESARGFRCVGAFP